MSYDFWYDIAEYGNINWKGNFSAREVAMNAFEYYEEWRNCFIFHKVMPCIVDLLDLLREDHTEEAESFIETITSEIEYHKLDEDEE